MAGPEVYMAEPKIHVFDLNGCFAMDVPKVYMAEPNIRVFDLT
jgi:hypothetical protein